MKPWERWELRFLERHYGRRPLWHLCVCLERSEASIKSRAVKAGLGPRRHYTEAEKDFVRRNHRLLTAPQLAAKLRRTRSSVHQLIARLGLSTRRPQIHKQPGFRRRLCRLVRESLCNRHIAAELGCERHAVSVWRSRFGLAPAPRDGNAIASCPRCLARVKQNTARQCREAGVKSLVEIRALAFRKYARESGWPEDLRPRGVQILNALYERGPMTRRQLAEVIGMRADYAGKHGQRKVLASNDPEGSYLAHLQQRGLVVRLGRLVGGNGKGRNVNLYALPVWVERAS